jgi:oligoribonuclease (3'-5' exoribonuclease)
MTYAKHVMIDCETLALDSKAAVWSLAAVEFDIEADLLIVGNSYETLTNQAQIYDLVDKGLLVSDQKAIDWTLAEGDVHGYLQWCVEDAAKSIDEIHKDLSKSIGPQTIVWAKNVSFDNPILQNLFKVAGHQTPWHYRNVGELYTVKHVAMLRGVEPWVNPAQNVLSAHVAINDCLTAIDEMAYYLGLMVAKVAPTSYI